MTGFTLPLLLKGQNDCSPIDFEIERLQFVANLPHQTRFPCVIFVLPMPFLVRSAIGRVSVLFDGWFLLLIVRFKLVLAGFPAPKGWQP